LVKLNNEFREYDFRKNLEIKTRLCEAAEKLVDEPDIISAFHQLQKLHQEFRATGPVAKELREEIWQRFKASSSAINKRHQQYFEQQKEREQNNLDEKTVICEIAEAMEYDSFTTFQQWEDKTQEILALQTKWKGIGYAPQKMNVKIFERFRASCDEFFRRKALFYKTVKESMAGNLERKKELCAKAEALKDSTDWKETAETLTQLQKEWKTIGPVPKKHSDAVWKRFIGACDYFFDQKNRASNSARTAEQENLIGKKDVLAKLNELDESGDASDETADKVRELMKQWNAIGHVPFKEKDKMYKQYHTVIDSLFDRLNLSNAQKRLNSFKSNLGKGDSTFRERERLVRTYENMKNEIQTYENNLGFLSSSSKKGSSIVTELTRKVEKLKGELELVKEKIRVIDAANAEEDPQA
jgi:archaellum component FlaC